MNSGISASANQLGVARAGPIGPELFFGLVTAAGTDGDLLCTLITASLDTVGYRCIEIRLSETLKEVSSSLRMAPEDARYLDHMDAGDDLRRRSGRKDALALMGVRKLAQTRTEKNGETGAEGGVPLFRTAYLLRSLKTPEEVETLRNIYGGGFFLIAAYSPQDDRERYLAERIAASHQRKAGSADLEAAKAIIKRDESDNEDPYGQNVRNAFPRADLFVDVSLGREKVEQELDRFVKLIFGFEFHTPTRDESGMFHARAASVRSAELGRQVGAAITTSDGELVAVGVNELPVAGGGLVWEEDVTEDPRDWKLGYDTNDRTKDQNLLEVLDILAKERWLDPEHQARTSEERLEMCRGLLKETRMMNATEFGRAVHAEMAAITSAATRGVPIENHTLYTTTFPCHNCARHIIAAGIRRVVYIEPYAKSLASRFHKYAMRLDTSREDLLERKSGIKPTDGKVRFEAFVGVAPRIYLTLFSMSKRKEKGVTVEWDGPSAVPRSALSPQHLTYFQREEVKPAVLSIALPLE